MKTTLKLLPLIMLALPMSMQAQLHECNISKAFDDIVSAKGIHVSVSQSTTRDVNGAHAERTMVHDFQVGKSHLSLLDKLQKAFQQDYNDAATFYTCFNPMPDSHRQLWEVKLKQGGNYRIGQKPNSSYAIATFDDETRPGFRTVYAAEWWNTDDPDIRQGMLLRSYGEKPAMASHLATPDIDPKWLHQFGIPDSILSKVYGGLPDLSKYFDGRSLVMGSASATPANIPMGQGGPGEWLGKAINNIGHLSNGDWHRVFGLITQKMMDRAQKESPEDLVVAAGIILDLCKNADQLDDDERKVSANRLVDVAQHYFDNDKHQYIHDLLMLGAKKLEKK